MKPRHRLLGLVALLIASLAQATAPALAQMQPLSPMQINLATANGGAQNLSIPRGKSAKLTVTLKAGKYPYKCTVAGHAAAGMKGTLVVK